MRFMARTPSLDAGKMVGEYGLSALVDWAAVGQENTAEQIATAQACAVKRGRLRMRRNAPM
jgi:hypothetical protein